MWQKPIQTLTSSPLSTLGWRFYGAPARKKHRDPRHDPFALTKSRVSVSRQVAKLQQVDTRFAVTVSKRCRKIVDFGATPGSWSQYLWGRLWQRKEGTVKPRRDGDLRLIAVDLHPLSPRITHANNYPNLQFVPGDVRDPNVRNKVVELLDGRADLIVADLLPSPHDLTKRDKGLSLELLKSIWTFAKDNLNTKGDLVMKYYHDEDALEFEEQVLKSYFVGVHRSRSSSRRPEPSETFFVCKSYLGPDGDKDRIEALATGSTPEEQ